MIAMSSTLFAPAAEAHPAWFTFDGAASFTPRSESTATARSQASLSSLRAPDFTDLMTEEDPMTRQQNECGAPGAAARPAEVIRLDNVTKAYQGSVTKAYQEGGRPALVEVSMSVAAGEVAAIMGPSGSGKSTLLNLIAGLDRPTAGTVTVAGQRIDTLGESALARFRARHIGIIFQFFNLLDDLTVEDNVLLPAQLAGASRRRARARAGELLDRMGLADQRNAYPARLSGGQRQRVAIARALVNAPELLLADEPTGALDTATGQQIGRLLSELNAAGQTLVLVTHDPALATRYAARTIQIVDGQVVDAQGASVGAGASA
jgi:putative ABC transport system ATP-binding protein